jgi:integrase
MNKVQPIRKPEDVERFKEYFRHNHSHRDYMLFLLGCNTALRVGDLLSLTAKEVRTQDWHTIREHITIHDEKTGKLNRFKLPQTVREQLWEYTIGFGPDDYLFPSRIGGGERPISSVQAWRIMHTAAETLGVKEIGTHSMRKTWAYHAYQRTKDLAIVQTKLNHTSDVMTKRYIGIQDDEVEKALEGFEL